MGVIDDLRTRMTFTEWVKEEGVPVFIVGALVTCYVILVGMGRTIPDHLVNLVVIVVTFYFVPKSLTDAQRQTRQAVIEDRVSQEAIKNGDGRSPGA